MPIIAAAVGGHGRADWGNWAKRQLRDQNGDDAGEWIEMGRGSRFRYQKSDGSIGTGTATYVGFSDKPNHGRFYVKGVDGVQEGVYDLDAGSVDPVKFYFAEGTKVGDYLENYYKSIGRNLDDIDANSKLPVIDFSALTPSQLTQEEADEIKTENRMPPPRNLDEELKSRTEGVKTASELQEGDIVFDEALNRYGSVELVEPSPDNSGNVDAVVRWSNNQVQELTNLPADQEIKVWPQAEDRSAVDAKKAKPATKLAEDIVVGDKIVKDGKNYTISGVKKLQAGSQFMAKPDDGGPEEKFSLKDEDKVELAPAAQAEQPLEQAPVTPATQAPVVEQAKTKPASKLKKGDQIQAGGETYTVVSVAKAKGDTGEVSVTVTSESTGDAQIKLKFGENEAIDLVQPKAPAAEAEPVDLEKQKYEDALANGAQRDPASLKYGDVIKNKNGDEFIVISTKQDRDKNNELVLAATLQAPNGDIVTLNLDPDKKYPVLVQKSKKANEKDPFKLENVYRKPNVEGQPNQGQSEEDEEESSQPATTTDGEKAIEDLKVNDIVVIDGKTYRFVAADENEDGTVQLVLKDSKGKEFIPEVDYKYEDVVKTAAKMGSKSKAKAAAEPTIAVPGAKGLPGSKGSFVKTKDGKRRVTYEVLGNGRVVMIFGYPGIATNSTTHLTIQNAVAKMPKTLGKFTPPFFYNGDGKKKSATGEGTQDFLSEEETRKNWVIELNPGESESVQVLVENLINAIQKEFDESPVLEATQASKDEPITGEVNTAGILSDAPRVTYTVESNGKISVIGSVPEGYEGLREHLFDLYPDENVILDSDSQEIEVFPQSGQDIDALRSEVLAAVKKYVAGDNVEEEKVVEEEVVEEEEAVEEDRQKTYDIMQAAFEFYAKQMATKDNKGIKYLEARGYSPKAIEELGIIFAGDSKFSLSAHLTSLGFTVDEILATGLVNRFEDRLLDSFSNRVLFPFKDSKGRVVGFNGRDISGKSGAIKYILTAGPNETNKSVFNKSEVLYNLENTLDAVKETGQLILVEGQVDVLAYREAGINNVVAISGVSISPKQIELLQDTFGGDLKEIILSLDSDEPGKKATKNVYQTLADSGYDYEISTVTIPQGFKDAGEIFEDKNQGTEVLKYIIKERRDARIPEEDLATDDQFQEYVRLMHKYQGEMDETTLEYFSRKVFNNNTTKEQANDIIETLFEEYELPKLQAELDDVIKKAVAAKVISADYKLEIDYDIKTSTNKKETIEQAIENLKKKIEEKKPAVVKAQPTAAQRESINRRFSSGVVTQEQVNALVAILEKPDLTKEEIERVIRTLDLAENIWRINNGWTLDDRRGVVMTPPIIDLGVTPMQVVQRIKTYKPTKDINGNPLPQQPAAEDKKPAAEPTQEKPAAKAPDTSTPAPATSGTGNPEKLKDFIARAIGIGMGIRPNENQRQKEQRKQEISNIADGVIKQIEALGIKDYDGLAKLLNENDILSLSGDPWFTVRKYAREFLSPGYIKRQLDALDNIKNLFRERIPSADGEDLSKGLIDDILRPYLDDTADTNYEDLLDILDKNLKPGQIKHTPKLEIEKGMARGDWDEVVKAVQKVINDNLGKKQEPTPAIPATPTAAPATREAEPAKTGPSNLGAQTGTPSLPQTMDNFNADGRPAYAPKGGAFRGAKLQAQVDQAYKTGGVQGIRDFVDNSNVTPFDIESTGMSSYDGQLKPGNRIVQLGASKKGANGEQIFFNQFIRQEDGVVMSEWSAENLERPVLDENGNPTGEFVKIDKEWLDQQKSEKEVLEEFIKFIGADAILLAHNANFDISVLEEALDRNGLSLDVLGAIDTLDFVNTALPKYNGDGSRGKPIELDAPKRKKDEAKSEDIDPTDPANFRASAKLNDVLKFFGLEPTGWHRADADAYDASLILNNILDWLIKNPERESTNALGHRFLDFDKIAEQADKDLLSYLKAIGSGTPATDKQKSLNPKTNPGYEAEGFAPDLRKLKVPEAKIKEIIAPVQNMTRGQAEEYIASILSDARSGKDPDITKALQKAKSRLAPSRSSNTVPNAAPQGGGLREFEVSKRAKDLSIGDKIRAGDSDVYGIIKSIDKQTAGFVKISVQYEDGTSETLNAKANTLVAVYEKEKPSEAAINDSDEQPAEATPTEEPEVTTTITPTPTSAPEPAAMPGQGEATPESVVEEAGYPGLTIDLSDYPVADRDKVRKTFEQINELKKLNKTGLPIKIVESGEPVTDKETTPKFLDILTSKEEMYDIMKSIGLSDFKAKRLAKKLEDLKGKRNYFEELDKVNEELEAHKRNSKSFKSIEKDRGFRDYLVNRGLIPSVWESFEFILSEDPKIKAMRSRERDLYYAWSESLKKRGKTKTIKDGNISLTYSKDEAEQAQRLLEATKKIQETLPLDGRKLKVSVYSPEQLDLLNLGTIVGAALVTDKLGHIAISSNIVGRQEAESREGAKAGTIDSDTFTIAHEYGHIFDEVALDGQAREDFADQFGNAQLTEYGRENLSENFAEYIMDLAYSALKGEEPVSKEFKDFIDKAIEDGRINPKKLKKSGPFFGEDGIKPRRIVAKVGNQEIPELLEKTEEELKQFESATNIGNSNWGAWLRETDDAAGYIPNLANDIVAAKYSPVAGIDKEDFKTLSPEQQSLVLEQIRRVLNPVIEAQKKDGRTYRVFEVAGTNIHIRTKDGSVSPETLASVVNELKELNRFNDMGGMPVIVTLAENNTFSVAGEFLTGDYEGFNVLNQSKTQMHIVLNTAAKHEENPRNNFKKPIPEKGILNTLIHEYLGHGLAKVFLGQDINGNGGHDERFKEFESKFPLYSSDDKHPVSVYGNESIKESFAEFVRAGYLLMRNGQTTEGYPEIKRFLQYLDPLVTTLSPMLKTDQTGSDLANVDKMESASPKFPRAIKVHDANAELYIYSRRSAFYSNALDPYGRPVDPEFEETLTLAYTMAQGARSLYMKKPGPGADNFYRYAAYASIVNDLYNAKFFSYPKNNPRQNVDSVLENIVTSEGPGSIRRWQSDKPFVPLRYSSREAKFNNDFVAGTYTDASGNTYQIAYVSSKPANPSDDVSESAYVFVSKPNQSLGDFVDFDSTLNDLIKNSAGQLKIRNHESGGLLDRGELEIQGTKVDGAYRRRGLATAMLAFAKQNSAKYLRFSKEQTVQEDAWARSVDQNPKNHLGLPAFTNSQSGLNPSNISPIADSGLLAGESSEEQTRINFNPNNRNSTEEDLFAEAASEYLSNPVFAGSRDYSSSTGGGLGPTNSVVSAVSVETLSSIAGNEVDEARVKELIEKINANKGFSDPVVVYYNPKTGQSVVADGNHHVEAAKRIGLTHIPTRVITGEFDSSEYLSPKVVGKEWSWPQKPFTSRDWPMHVNPYFVFNNSDLVSSLEETPIVDPLRDRVIMKSGAEGLSPDMDDISKLMGKLVKDSQTGQIYQVLEEYKDNEGNATGKVVVVRFVGILDDPNLGLTRKTELVDGRFNFDSSGKIYLAKGSVSINDEDPYNDLRQYEAELRSVEDLEDVTESFLKSGGQSLIVAESMFFAWTKENKKGRISKFVSPGVVELAVLTGVDENGDKEFNFYNIPVTELLPIQNQRETLGSEPAKHSLDMRPIGSTVDNMTKLLRSLKTKGFLSEEYFNAITTAVNGGFQTASGVEDMYNSLIKLRKRRKDILEKSGKLQEMFLTKNVRVQVGPAKESAESTTTPATAPATPATPATPAVTPALPPIVRGRMSFRQLFEENKNKNGAPTVDRMVNGPTPIPDSENPIGKPAIEDVREVLEILSEISGYDESYISKQEEDVIINSLPIATPGLVSDYLETLRAKILKKRLEKKEPISKINLPKGLNQENKDKLEKYSPEFNLDGSPYEKETTIVDDDQETRELVDFIDVGLLPGSILLITGGAGTGKSTVLRRAISELGARKNIITVAPTGAAAHNVGEGLASTIHSVFRIDPNVIIAEDFTVEDPSNPGEQITTLDLFTRDLRRDGKRLKLFKQLDVLTIDEISMVDANLMELMDISLRVARNNQLPFGGVKVVAFGDDNQLPPVEAWSLSKQKKLIKDLEEIDDLSFADSSKEETENKKNLLLKKSKLARDRHEYMLTEYGGYRWYKSNVVGVSNPLAYVLTKNRRQEKDKKYADTLKKIPMAQVTASELDYFNESVVDVPQELLDAGIIRLVLTNARADSINEGEITKLQRAGAEGLEFVGEYTGEGKAAFNPENLHAPEKITYYVGEKVIFIQNDTPDLRKAAGYQGKDNRWVNGTQGTVLGFDENDGLPIVEILREDGTKEKVKVGQGKSIANGAVESTQLDELTGQVSEKSVVGILAEYTQIPMLPAYAMTMHKSQGRSMERAIVDLQDADGTDGQAFAAGQLYVALSRLTSKDGLFLTRKLDYKDFMVDVDNEQYYAELVEMTQESLKAEAEAAKASQGPSVDKKVNSRDKVLLSNVTKADVKEAKKILEHKTKSIPNLPSDWGTRDSSDHFFSEFGYGEKDSFDRNLDAIMSEKLEDLFLEQKLLVSLIVAHGKADIYEHSESGTTIKRYLKNSLFSKTDASDDQVVRAASAHRRILDSGYVIDGGRMDINLRDLSYIGEKASGLYSASKDEINLDTNQAYGWRLQDQRNRMSQDDQLTYVLAHEYGHALDNKFAENGTRLSEVLESLIKSGMQNRAKEILRGYALSNSPEYFAESYAGLVLQSVLNQLGYSDKTSMDEDLIAEIKNRINLRNSQ